MRGAFMKLTKTATYWTMAASFTLLIGMSSAFAQDVHICEELMRQEHTEADMKKCIEEFGEPESFRTNRDEQRRSDQAREETQRELEKYYDKSFTAQELLRFGAPYVALQGLYRNDGRVRRIKKMTKPQDLCIYLGYEKALNDGQLSEIMEDFEHDGFVGVKVDSYTDQSGLTHSDAEQFKFNDRQPSYIQVYKSITCRRERKEGDPQSSTVQSDSSEQPVSSAPARSVNTSTRRNNSGTLPANSPYLYNPQSSTGSSNR